MCIPMIVGGLTTAVRMRAQLLWAEDPWVLSTFNGVLSVPTIEATYMYGSTRVATLAQPGSGLNKQTNYVTQAVIGQNKCRYCISQGQTQRTAPPPTITITITAVFT